MPTKVPVKANCEQNRRVRVRVIQNRTEVQVQFLQRGEKVESMVDEATTLHISEVSDADAAQAIEAERALGASVEE
jgi:hypothetical protein